ncbi:MAG: hypothetical protein ACRDV1_16320 [Actinomycetes bacterium]
MLVSAAVCPHPPLLVPELAAGAAAELDDLRSACAEAIGGLVASRPDLLVVVGQAPVVGPFPAAAWGSLRPYGVDIRVGTGPGPASLPLSLTIGRWLLDRSGVTVPWLLFGVPADAPPGRCADLGAALADRAPRVALLVMGDGTGRRVPKPGYLDERAEPYDDAVVEALRTVDREALLALDPALAVELLVAGRAAWQVLAGATQGEGWVGDVTYAAAPYGVGYLVATWLRTTA